MKGCEKAQSAPASKAGCRSSPRLRERLLLVVGASLIGHVPLLGLDEGWAPLPPQPAGALDRQPKAKTAAEAEFLALGAGARMWLTEAAAAGTTKVRVKMAEAVALAKLGDPVKVDWALGHAAVNNRFAEADLSSIVSHHARVNAGPRHQASETRSLTQGTGAWSALLGRDDEFVVSMPADLDPLAVDVNSDVNGEVLR